LHIRPERPLDAATIRAVVIAAFKDAPYSNQTEADIIDALRSAGALSVSLVATDHDDIIGQVAFSPVRIAQARGDWYGIGPVAVRPDRQRQGIGQALIAEGLRCLSSLRAAGCVVLGDPHYYHRFGFEADPALTYGGKPSPYFRRLVLNGPPASGEVSYHAAFGSG
jgi:predicted N-acetyltransferase YhbS